MRAALLFFSLLAPSPQAARAESPPAGSIAELTQKAKNALDAGDSAAALRYAQRALELDPTSAQSRHLLSQASPSPGSTKRMRTYSPGLSGAGRSPEEQETLVRMKMKDYEGALMTATQEVARDPLSRWGHRARASCLFYFGRYGDAQLSARAHLRLNPSDREALSILKLSQTRLSWHVPAKPNPVPAPPGGHFAFDSPPAAPPDPGAALRATALWAALFAVLTGMTLAVVNLRRGRRVPKGVPGPAPGAKTTPALPREPEPEDPHAILGVTPGAKFSEIEAAYRRRLAASAARDAEALQRAYKELLSRP